MDNNLHAYYYLNKSIRNVTTSGDITNISITHIPEHISFKILYDITKDGSTSVINHSYVAFKDQQGYDWLYDLLFPTPNLAVALCHVQNPNDSIRNLCICIIKKSIVSIYFDDWLDNNRNNIYMAFR